MKKTIRYLCGASSLVCAIILSAVTYWNMRLPDTYLVQTGTELCIDETIVATAPVPGSDGVATVNLANQTSYQTVLKLYGVFPIKNVTVNVVSTPTVILGGMPFGIKLYTDGVLVVALSEVDAKSGRTSPAKKSGVCVGDLILSINGKEVFTNDEVAALVESSRGKELTLQIKRNGVESTVKLKPEKSVGEGKYKIGLWVRDSSAGIGTVTFYDPKTNLLCGLGHPVCDVDTGKIIPICTGEIVPARIYSVKKGLSGSPGELQGGFESGSLGVLMSNNQAGVYSSMKTPLVGETVQIALKQEIKEGDAQILTTVSGSKPEWYTVKIKEINYKSPTPTRNMVLEITDERLLSETGGIVQGKSGSPIVQNGKLIGAVTHVLVNDPTKGYAIFAENMLETAHSIANGKELQGVA